MNHGMCNWENSFDLNHSWKGLRAISVFLPFENKHILGERKRERIGKEMSIWGFQLFPAGSWLCKPGRRKGRRAVCWPPLSSGERAWRGGSTLWCQMLLLKVPLFHMWAVWFSFLAPPQASFFFFFKWLYYLIVSMPCEMQWAFF